MTLLDSYTKSKEISIKLNSINIKDLKVGEVLKHKKFSDCMTVTNIEDGFVTVKLK